MHFQNTGARRAEEKPRTITPFRAIGRNGQRLAACEKWARTAKDRPSYGDLRPAPPLSKTWFAGK